MNYILCEDSGSGYEFYKYVANICAPYDSVVLTSYGNSGYLTQLTNLSRNLKVGDVLLLAFDSVEMTKDFNPKYVIDYAKSICKKLGVHLYYVNYYCFEEFILSYKYLANMFYDGRYKDSDKYFWYTLLKEIHTSIFNKQDYYDKTKSNIKYVIENTKSAGKTREKFAKAVLAHISGSIIGDFKIYSGKFGKCWLTSCSKVNLKNKDYVCNSCNSRFKLCPAILKLKEIESETMSSLNKSFTSILK